MLGMSRVDNNDGSTINSIRKLHTRNISEIFKAPFNNASAYLYVGPYRNSHEQLEIVFDHDNYLKGRNYDISQFTNVLYKYDGDRTIKITISDIDDCYGSDYSKRKIIIENPKKYNRAKIEFNNNADFNKISIDNKELRSDSRWKHFFVDIQFVNNHEVDIVFKDTSTNSIPNPNPISNYLNKKTKTINTVVRSSYYGDPLYCITVYTPISEKLLYI